MRSSHPGLEKTQPLVSQAAALQRTLLACVAVMILSLSGFSSNLAGQEAKSQKYGPDVVAKAEKILEDESLRRSGKQIQATGTSDITRAISGLNRAKRELRLVHKSWKAIGDRITATRRELQRLKGQYGELNLQLARVAGVDTSANNRIVGLLNATKIQMDLLNEQREQLTNEHATRRSALNDTESKYAEMVLAIRKDFSKTHQRVSESLVDEKVKIALRVMHANYDTPDALTADRVLASLDKRIQRIEQEIFSESIPLDVVNRSLYVTVVVGKKTTRMVVDSGASMICLPQKIATELGVVVPSDAREMQLVLADGGTIRARGVTLARVRVGEFEVENVEAAVLDVSANNAEPLLGMSFLGNFKFEIDAADKSLKMLRVKAE